VTDERGRQERRRRREGAIPGVLCESAIRAKPDVIIDAVMGHESGGEQLKALPGLREARWVSVPSEDLLHPGPNIGRGLRTLFEMIHGVPAPDAGVS